jgi:hypothetical protein
MPKKPNESGSNASRQNPKFDWKGSPSLRRVHALNERCLEVMVQLARADRERPAIDVVNRFRSLWCSLDVPARQRAARCPVLLIDVHFQSWDWWRWANDPRSGNRRAVLPQPYFPARAAGELMRETLMLAWSTAGADQSTASVLLGMTPAVSKIIAELEPQDVERIAARYSRHLRPRWEDLPQFWRRLLSAARAGDEDLLHDAHLHSIQLLGGELIPTLDNSAAR